MCSVRQWEGGKWGIPARWHDKNNISASVSVRRADLAGCLHFSSTSWPVTALLRVPLSSVFLLSGAESGLAFVAGDRGAPGIS